MDLSKAEEYIDFLKEKNKFEIKKTKYLELCQEFLLSTQDDILYQKSELLIDILYSFILKQKILSSSPKNLDFVSVLHDIYRGVNRDDTNYIGKVNIFSFQCAVLLSHNILFKKTKEFWRKLQEKNTKFLALLNVYTKRFHGSMLYTSYDDMVSKMTTSDNNENIYKVPVRVLITAVSYFTLDELLTSYLEETYYCGICYDVEFADGIERTPIDFLVHDIGHALDYISLCANKYSMFINFKDFYFFCRNNFNGEILQSVKFIIFLLLHESDCSFVFSDWETTTELMFTESLIKNLLNNPRQFINISDFIEDNGLWLLIPKKYRSMEKQDERLTIIVNYFELSCKRFFEALTQFKQPVVGGKSNRYTRRIRRTKQRRNSMKRRKLRKYRH